MDEPRPGLPVDRPIRVLIVEDRDWDAELVAATLEAAGLRLEWTQVDREDEFVRLLADPDAPVDLVLADFNVPAFGAPRVLELIGSEVAAPPVIVVSGTIGEETAVDCMRRGATDYLFKDRLGRLPSAVIRALERVQAARSMRAADLRYRTLVEQLPAVLYIDEVGRDTVYVSPQVDAIFGISPEDWLASHDSWVDLIHPDDRGRAIGEAGHLPGAAPAGRFEYRVVRPDEREIIVRDDWVTVSDPASGRTWVHGMIADVTAERTAEAELARAHAELGDLHRAVAAELAERRRSEERYRLLFQGHPAPLAVWDPATLELLDVNDAALDLYGYGRDELLAMTVDRLVDPRDWDLVVEALARVEPGIAGATTFRHLRKDGGIIEVEVTGHPLVFEGRPARVIMVVDVTERRRLEGQLRQSQKMEAIGQLAGGIAHDFNNLLTAILGQATLLLDELPPGTPAHDSAADIAEAARRSADLTRELLAFSRQQILRPEVVDVNRTVLGVLSLIRRVIEADAEPAIEVEFAPATDLPPVRVDPGQLGLVLINLAVNARDAMPGGGRITITTSAIELDSAAAASLLPTMAPGTYTVLSVADTGTGMDEHVRSHLFEPFFTTKEIGKGTGLGLSVVYGIIKQSEGWIIVSSEVGRGSRFDIYLPVAPEWRPASSGEVERRSVPRSRQATGVARR